MRLRHLALVAAATCLLVPSSAPAVILDTFLQPLPPHPDLPVSQRTILWMGSRCDGNACPPQLIVNHSGVDEADQSGLAGVLGGNRKTTLTEVSGNCNVNIIGSIGALTFNHDAGATKGILDLDYGETVNLDADLTVGASTGIEIQIAGDGDDSVPVRPILCTITVTTGRGTPAETTVAAGQTLIADGIYLFPFATFAGADFADVDRVRVRFDTSQQFGAIDFAVYPIRTDETPVPVRAMTWGGLKARHD
jgi:hypothetical protein